MGASHSLQKVINYYGRLCVYCSRTNVKLTRDHWIPKSKGGIDIVPACFECNQAKKDKMPHEFTKKHIIEYVEIVQEQMRLDKQAQVDKYARKPKRKGKIKP